MIFFKYFTFGRPDNINDLRASQHNSNPSRNEVPIAVIDDEEFRYREMLNRSNFHIRQYMDINDVRDISDYAIVLCDIEGVGNEFGSEYEGAYIIKEVKRKYPNKIVIAYSAYSFDPDYNKFFEKADFVFNKDRGFDKWEESLSEAISLATDPIEQWKKVRDYMLMNNIPLYTIFKLEQGYIRAVKERNKNQLLDRVESSGMPDEVKDALNNFVSGAFFSLAV